MKTKFGTTFAFHFTFFFTSTFVKKGVIVKLQIEFVTIQSVSEKTEHIHCKFTSERF